MDAFKIGDRVKLTGPVLARQPSYDDTEGEVLAFHMCVEQRKYYDVLWTRGVYSWSTLAHEDDLAPVVPQGK